MMYKKKEVPTQSIGTRIKSFGAHYSIVLVFHYSNCERSELSSFLTNLRLATGDVKTRPPG
ncbi:MAG: hypothetical protein J7J91_02525, partial [Deltaproteobacteria bacterium]|nr:hypothetical protein [Deltaproteobacteria bacterium]